jgi:hypothetical protein
VDPDPGSGTFLPLDPGQKKPESQDPGSGMSIPDFIFESLNSIYTPINFSNLITKLGISYMGYKYFDEDPGWKKRILYPG